VLDRKWREHLYEMDYLKEGIGLRAMAQRDPLIEYQREGFQLFTAMTDAIKEESVQYLFNLEVQVAQPTDAPVVSADSAAAAAGSAGAAAAASRTDEVEDAPGVLVGKGLDGPAQRTPLQYSAPSADGDGAVVTRAEDGTGPARAAAAPSGSANRADRRKQAKQRKR